MLNLFKSASGGDFCKEFIITHFTSFYGQKICIQSHKNSLIIAAAKKLFKFININFVKKLEP